MLDPETKRRIDNCRDILVGKVPDPKSQVEQITIALIYKFMDDMDARSENAGGKRTYFSGGYARYGWTKLMTPGMGGQEMLNLYAEVIQKMSENSKLPELFRNIFKDAYLPYRDPETLRAFLKEIDGFTYDHSERLGDAFEYLLSVLGSQGDAGQFRTPRHIIDFMVEIIDPKTGEKILDPACGTAGFLISSYKHIWARNMKNGRTTLTPKKRKDLAENITGYDISPDMVRLSLVNMYLHGFAQPDIHEYDTLTSEDRWGDYAHVILANPPFMSPKGGIRPHQRFSVKANRSEVLFVDYIAEHLLPTGRAGVIVPEGVIFQSGTAYKQLRKMLVEGSLAAVISLPKGVFNPYSGVQTSILILDKQLAKRTDSILFAKIEHDGFNLGAQRRPIDENDLPTTAEYIKGWLSAARAGKPFEAEGMVNVHLVGKAQIAEDGNYDLTGDHYHVAPDDTHAKWPMVALGEVLEYEQPTDYIVKSTNYKDEYKTPVLTAGKSFLLGYTNEENGIFPVKDLPVIIFDDFTTAIKFVNFPFKVKSSAMKILKANDRIDIKFAFYMMQKIKFDPAQHKRYWISRYSNIKILLPPLGVQREIVAEIDGYQKIIDAARQIISAYRPHIPLNPDWPMVELGDICELIGGGTPSKQNESYWKNGSVKWISSRHINEYGHITGFALILKRAVEETSTRIAPKNSTIIITRVSVGKFAFADDDYAINQDLTALVLKDDKLLTPKFIFAISPYIAALVERSAEGIGVRGVTRSFLSKLQIPLPPLDVQEKIVAEIEKEQQLVDSNKELIAIFEQKIKEKFTKLWSE